MRRLVTGLDSSGRTCIVEETTFPDPADAPAMDVIHQTPTAPPPARPPGNAMSLDLGVAPGIARWMLVQYQPGMDAFIHHTDTIDFDVVISGWVELILDDGAHRLEAGDCVVVTGVDHGWRTGAQGCTSSVVVIGTPSPE